MELTDKSNLSDLLRKRVEETPDGLAYRQFDGRQWVNMTWGEVGREVGRWQAAMTAAGLQPGDRVSLCMHNRIEWVCCDQAALGLGLVVVPLYFDDRADNMSWCLNDAGIRLLVLEDGNMWSALKDQVQTIERVICLQAAPTSDPKVTTLQDWLPQTGGALAPLTVDPDTLATIVYTSGTTGRPKGVMLSHRNIVSNALVALSAFPISSSDLLLSFLPLSHMFERTTGYYLAIAVGAQTVYARSISTLAEDMLQQRPTILITVPRIFERIYAKMQEAMPPGSLKRRLFELAYETGWRRFEGQATLKDKLLWPLLSLLVAKKLHRRLGGRMWLIIVGGAALAPNLARVFIGLGLPIIHGYGITETSPVISANLLTDNVPASVGRPLEGVEIRCSEDGELLVRGPNVMLGYWNNAEATAAAIDDDGWFHTGDIVQIKDGRIHITGRVKEIIVLSSGEKVPPGDIEQVISQDPIFEQVMLVGEGRPKLGLLVKSDVEDLQVLCDHANKQLHGFPGYAQICHIAHVQDEWTVESGMLTPTLKLKRPVIEKKYAEQIEAMYQG